jgi:hypothetical protein
VATRENGLTHEALALSLSPSRTLVTPYCKRIRPGRRTTRGHGFPLLFSPCDPSRTDPSGLGHAAQIYSSVQGPPPPPGSKRRHHATQLPRGLEVPFISTEETRQGNTTRPSQSSTSFIKPATVSEESDRNTINPRTSLHQQLPYRPSPFRVR